MIRSLVLAVVLAVFALPALAGPMCGGAAEQSASVPEPVTTAGDASEGDTSG